MTSISILSSVYARIQLYLQENFTQNSDNWGNEFQTLLSVLERISRLLKDVNEEIRQQKHILGLEKDIVRLSYDIDDAIASNENVVRNRLSRIRSFVGVPDKRINRDLRSLKKDLEETARKLQSGLIVSNNTEATNLDHASILAVSSTRELDPAQIEEDKLKDALLNKNLSVVCIWGESGAGKNALAGKAFYQTQIRKHFELFALVTIYSDFQAKKVLQDILLQLLPYRKLETWDMDEIELTLEISEVLKKKKCLVVLENLRNLQDWQSIRKAFPTDDDASKSNSKSKSKSKSRSKARSSSKILITTSSKEVAIASAVSVDGLLEMKPLTETQCLKLLEEQADFDSDELQTVGKIIFSISGGSPLIAVILGRALKTLTGAAQRNQMLHHLNSYLSTTEISKGSAQVLELSYNRLPHELKPCLLYMGLFPKGKSIELDKLHLFLAAEGFIFPECSEKGKALPMESLRKMLELLVYRKLVDAQENKVSTARMYKSCRLHSKTRSFCITKGEDEDFFEIVDFKDQKKVKMYMRRLAVYLSKYEDGEEIQFISQDTKKKTRSLLIFDTFNSKETLWPEGINDLKEFNHLRVLDFDEVDFNIRQIPKGMDNLVLLRYLSFRECYLETLPFAISKFPCLETLDLRVKAECKMTIPNVLSNLNRLKHLYFPLVYESDCNSKLQLRRLVMLEILVNFNSRVCNIDDLPHFHNLQILTTISEVNPQKPNELDGIINYLDDKTVNYLQQSSLDIKNFDCYAGDTTEIFNKLLACKSIQSLHIEGQIGDLLETVEISQNFTEMVFDGSEFEDDPMNVLGNLEHLRSLTLCNDAFIGTNMTISIASKFPELRILKLLNLQYLEKLTFGKGTMPKLSTLEIRKCEDLEEVMMSKALDNGLRLAEGKKGDDFYFVEPPPTVINYDNESGNPQSAP